MAACSVLASVVMKIIGVTDPYTVPVPVSIVQEIVRANPLADPTVPARAPIIIEVAYPDMGKVLRLQLKS